MPKEERNNRFVSLRSMFLNESVRRMKDIETLYPTEIAKSLGINHSRYIRKLYNPQEFTIQHIADFARLLDLDIRIILEVILRQVKSTLK